jgi:hypothetical protein
LGKEGFGGSGENAGEEYGRVLTGVRWGVEGGIKDAGEDVQAIVVAEEGRKASRVNT